MSGVILCRFGELFLKQGNRSRFERQLVENIRRALVGLADPRVESPHGRVLVRVGPDDLEEACTRLQRIFGLVSVSPAEDVPPHIEALTDAAVRCAQAVLERNPAQGRSFKIDARRADKRFPFSSQELGVRLGAAVAAATGVPVNLREPALVVGVEIGHGGAFVFGETRPAPGGLPVGASGRALLLLSGGIDSPVAGWLAAKRGLSLDALYFHSPPFVGEKSKDKVASLGRILGRWQALRTLYVAHFTESQKRLREAGPAELAVVLYRRMMMRVADLLADKLGAQGLVTGENLGQVASQTVVNIKTIESAARHLVLRPLLTYDKQETVALARQIGSFDVSALPFEDCCSLFVPPHPATAARLADVERAESRLDVGTEAAAMADSLEAIPLG
jgi:tRNA uracil 4-sulfurtransferase